MRSTGAFAVLLAAGLPLAGAPGGQEPTPLPPSFPAQVSAITVDVVVLDKSGAPVRGLTRDSTLAWLSIPLDLQQIGDVVFRLEPRFNMPVWSAFLMIALLIVASIVVLERRVRGIEVVA